MMENPRLGEDNIIKSVRNLFTLEKLKKETFNTTIKDIRNLLRLEEESIEDRVLTSIRNVLRLGKENKTIKDIRIRNIRYFFDDE